MNNVLGPPHKIPANGGGGVDIKWNGLERAELCVTGQARSAPGAWMTREIAGFEKLRPLAFQNCGTSQSAGEL